jgi:hypothetical protein
LGIPHKISALVDQWFSSYGFFKWPKRGIFAVINKKEKKDSHGRESTKPKKKKLS